MSKKLENPLERKVFSPFITRINASKKSDFDKYYIDRDVKEVFKATGQVDENGDALGVVELKIIDKKLDISEVLESQRDSVGVEAYIKSLSLQGENINDFGTVVDDKINDFSEMPNTLADVMTAGDKAKEAFANMDPVLKGEHTTIEGFLNSLSQEKVDSYIKARLEALTPKKESVEGE